MSNNDYVKMRHFQWIMGIMVTVMMGMFVYITTCIATMDQKVDINRVEYMQIEARLSEIQTDILWIKRELNSK